MKAKDYKDLTREEKWELLNKPRTKKDVENILKNFNTETENWSCFWQDEYDEQGYCYLIVLCEFTEDGKDGYENWALASVYKHDPSQVEK